MASRIISEVRYDLPGYMLDISQQSEYFFACMEEPPKTLSKNQQKKLIKRERIEAKKLFNKAKRKLQPRKPSANRKRKKLVDVTKYKVVLDLSFDNLMTEKEHGSTINQVGISYADNRGRDKALDLYATSISNRTHNELLRRHIDYKRWNMKLKNEHFTRVDFNAAQDPENYASDDNEERVLTADQEALDQDFLAETSQIGTIEPSNIEENNDELRTAPDAPEDAPVNSQFCYLTGTSF